MYMSYSGKKDCRGPADSRNDSEAGPFWRQTQVLALDLEMLLLVAYVELICFSSFFSKRSISMDKRKGKFVIIVAVEVPEVMGYEMHFYPDQLD